MYITQTNSQAAYKTLTTMVAKMEQQLNETRFMVQNKEIELRDQKVLFDDVRSFLISSYGHGTLNGFIAF